MSLRFLSKVWGAARTVWRGIPKEQRTSVLRGAAQWLRNKRRNWITVIADWLEPVALAALV